MINNQHKLIFTSNSTGDRILSKNDVIHLTGLSKSTIYMYIRDSKFPSPVKIGVRRVGWLESEISNWLQDKVSKRTSIKIDPTF